MRREACGLSRGIRPPWSDHEKRRRSVAAGRPNGCAVVSADPWRRPLSRHAKSARGTSRLHYLSQIARAADELGYFGVLLPTGRSCEDSWVVASALVPLTQRLRFLVAVRPGLQTPTVAARMAATLDRLSDGRLLINVVTGGDPVELHGDGVFSRPWRALRAHRRISSGLARAAGRRERRLQGRASRDRRRASCSIRRCRQPHPPLYFGGSSDAGHRVAAEHVDVYLTWGEPPGDVAAKIATGARAGGRAGPHVVLRHPPPCHRARNRPRGLARGRRV